jgi:sugar phosphate permease
MNSIIILSLFHPQPDELELIIELSEHIAMLENKGTYLNTINETEAEDAAMNNMPEPEQGVTLKEALQIPGVLSYGFSFFCVKFAVYALLLWLPLFLTNELNYDNSQIANMQSAIEIGNLFGGAVLGLISDYCYSKRAPAGVFAVVVSFLIVFNLTWTY